MAAALHLAARHHLTLPIWLVRLSHRSRLGVFPPRPWVRPGAGTRVLAPEYCPPPGSHGSAIATVCVSQLSCRPVIDKLTHPLFDWQGGVSVPLFAPEVGGMRRVEPVDHVVLAAAANAGDVPDDSREEHWELRHGEPPHGAFFHLFRPSKQDRLDESYAQQPQVGGQRCTSATAVLGERT
jgi:hypothetical protein